ncbi:MAG TPA: hypothetical protein VFB55_09105 [Verrucomicrobiae bacterium]|nr:hypothetical protein [Verrucomicrobiae bacterium]
MKTARPYVLLLGLLLVLCAGLAARLDCWFITWPGNRAQTLDPLEVMIGTGQKLLAPMFFREADVYFHSGYYPSIFDHSTAFRTEHIAADSGAAPDRNQGDEENFLGPPLDFFDAFSRHFYPSVHTHLDSGGAESAFEPELGGRSDGQVREILPWLRISAALDPDRAETYVVTAFWLGERMKHPHEAEAFLREGLRHLPGNPQLLFELGRIYFEQDHDLTRARFIWQAALNSWQRETGDKPLAEKLNRANENFETRFMYEQLHTYLALLEQKAGNTNAAIAHWKQAQLASPEPEAIQKHIDALEQKSGSGNPSADASR